MIIKPLKPPLEMLQTEALNRRLPKHHPQKERVSMRARNLRAGYNGESALQYHLQYLSDEFLIFHTLRLPDSRGHFQMDIFVLSAAFIVILEVKNIRDHVIFDEMGQAYRVEADKSEQGFSNPVYQVKLQHERLLQWLRKIGIPLLPIEKLVVYSSPSTVLKNLTNSSELPKIVIHKERLIEKINEFSTTHNRQRLSEEQLMQLSFQLLSSRTPPQTNVMKKYNIKKEELIKGVTCPACEALPMQRKGGKWVCTFCAATSKSAHSLAIQDYALLINPYIGNREAKNFLNLQSSYIAKDLLQKENLQHFGVNSGRKYKIHVGDVE